MTPVDLSQSGSHHSTASTVASSAATTSKESPRAQKLLHSAQEFEAILVSSWWQQMQRSISDPDENSDPGAETMQGIGIHSMAMAMAKSGGMGLARMLFHQLEPALAQGQTKDGLK